MRVAPEYLPVGRVISFTVAATAEGSGTPVAGTAFIRNYVPVVKASYTFEVPTNTEVRRIFFYGVKNVPVGTGSMTVPMPAAPEGFVEAPGYGQVSIPLQFIRF